LVIKIKNYRQSIIHVAHVYTVVQGGCVFPIEPFY